MAASWATAVLVRFVNRVIFDSYHERRMRNVEAEHDKANSVAF